MNKLRNLLIILMLMVSANTIAQDNIFDRDYTLHNVQLGYGGMFNDGYTHMFELSYYRATDIIFASAGPSIGVAGMITPEGKAFFGPQLGYEINILVFDVKLDARYIKNGVYVHPGLGMSLFGAVGLQVGYNACLNQKHASGFTLGMYVNLGKLNIM